MVSGTEGETSIKKQSRPAWYVWQGIGVMSNSFMYRKCRS